MSCATIVGRLPLKTGCGGQGELRPKGVVSAGLLKVLHGSLLLEIKLVELFYLCVAQRIISMGMLAE